MAITWTISPWKSFILSWWWTHQVFWKPWRQNYDWNIAAISSIDTNFDCSGFRHWHSAIGIDVYINNDSTEDREGMLRFMHLETETFMLYKPWWALPAGASWSMFATIYVDKWELELNWTREISLLIYDPIDFLDIYDIEVSNLSWLEYSTTRTPWMIWIEWDHIHYISSTQYEHYINHDWNTYWWWKDPWMIWIDENDHWRIYYIDSNWNERHTHIWDNKWDPNWNEQAELYKTGWMIRVSSENWNHWYITFIWKDWVKYRIMNWDV